MSKKPRSKYRPVAGAPAPEKLHQGSKTNYETPQMSAPATYKRPKRGQTNS